MANLMDLLQGQMSDTILDQLGQQVGGNREQTSAAVQGVFSTLMGALSKNAATPEGAGALLGALDRDHDGSVLDDLVGMVTGNSSQQQAQPSMLNGAGILKHVLGGKQSNMIEMIAQMSGLNKEGSSNLLIKLAPMVMGMLGKVKKQQNLDQGALQGFLRQSTDNYRQVEPKQDLITKLLDRDGDGNVADDVASMGMSFLGKLFKK